MSTATRANSGSYTILAKNFAGSDEVTVEVNVLGKNKQTRVYRLTNFSNVSVNG